MEDRTGNNPQSSAHPTTYGTPSADLVVFAGDRSNRHAARLNTLADGTHVIAAGMVQDVREHGTVDASRATLQLVNDFGQAAYVAADTDTLAEYSLFLMDGVEVSLHGIVRRPFQGDPELDDPRANYVQIVRVEPLFS